MTNRHNHSSAVTAGLIDQGRPACGQGDEWGNKPTDDQLAAQIERIIRANRLDGIPQISRKIADFLDPPQELKEPRCARCGFVLNGEAAQVRDEIWCHPCADTEPTTSAHSRPER